MAERDAELDDEEELGMDDPNDVDADIEDDTENPDDPDLEASDESLDDDLTDPPPRRQQPTRGESRHQRLANRAAEAERRERELAERLARIEGQQEVLTRQPNPGQSEAARLAEQERINNMSDREYAQYEARQLEQRTHQALQVQGFQAQDRLDKLDFRDLCRENTAYASVQKEVEARLETLRRQGSNVDRQTMADKILGERIAARAAKTAPKTRTQAAESVRRQKARPGSSGSDVGSERGSRESRRGETAEQRLARLDVRF